MSKYHLILVILPLLWQNVDAIMCHRCFSAMGGCGDQIDWRMFPWKDCGDSNYCVKVIEKEGNENRIIRECENELMKSARHRLRMPVLRRHGYCLAARKNDFWNPMQTTNDKIMYCFCNDWNGCNSAPQLTSIIVTPFLLLTSILTYVITKFL
ncbi:hypothetical protein ACJMK2_020575 [Sinanodonta woodiana]|uniref:Protein sleepless n=1 Tax=Sinanodonta woodiana TaxID=1069815 RepID=A0ABD3U188_SINWO